MKSRLGAAWGRSWLITILVITILLLAACGPSTPPEATAPEATAPVLEQAGNENAYPAQEPNLQPVESAYPPPVEIPEVVDAYPVDPPPLPDPTVVPESYPAAAEVFAEPRFRLDLPLNKEDRIVTGQAPPNLALAVVDVTSGGRVLGVGASDGDGRFTIGVQDLPEGYRVGITFSELQPGKTHADMSVEYFPHRGEGFMNIPNVGIFFDTAMVES